MEYYLIYSVRYEYTTPATTALWKPELLVVGSASAAAAVQCCLVVVGLARS
jgi:hypothetical protein